MTDWSPLCVALSSSFDDWMNSGSRAKAETGRVHLGVEILPAVRVNLLGLGLPRDVGGLYLLADHEHPIVDLLSHRRLLAIHDSQKLDHCGRVDAALDRLLLHGHLHLLLHGRGLSSRVHLLF